MGAIFAKQLKKRTLLIDLELQFGDCAIVLGADPKATLLDLVMTHGELDADKVSGFVTHHESGLHLLPAPLRPEEADLVTDDRLASLLTVAKQAYDIVLIDTPPNFNSTVLTALDRTNDLLVVASMDVPSLKSVKVCMQTLEMLHYPPEQVHILMNRAFTKVGLKRDEVERALGKKIRFDVPSNKAVPISVNRGIPVVMSDPRSDITKAIYDICVRLTPEAAAASAQAKDGFKLKRKDRKRIEAETRRQAAASAAALQTQLALDEEAA
jgi:pilus assembly protein CpaE